MNSQHQLSFRLLSFVPFLLLLTACTAGGMQFTTDTPAGFWYGLWHGIISFISLIIHLFNDTVVVYETNNTGGWYDFGFLLGVIFVWGGGGHVSCKTAVRKKRDKEWDEIGEKVEKKVMRKLENWAEDEESAQEDEKINNKEDWDAICEKVEKKLKRKIRDWADKD